MAITAHEFPITLDTSLKNNQLPFSINQGTTDTTLIITVSRLGQKLDVSDNAKLEITAIYSCGRGSYIEDTDSTYHATTATISSGVITLPLSEGITTASGSTQLIIKITDSLQTYSTSLILEVLQNPAYSPQSIPDNLPTFNQVKKEVETNKANIQTNTNSISDNTNAISNVDSKVDSAVVDIKSNDQDIGNNRKDIDTNSATIQTHATQIASKAEKDLSNVGEFNTALDGNLFFKKDGLLKDSGINIDTTSKLVNVPYSLKTLPNSILLGDNVTISQNGGFVQNFVKASQRRYLMLDYLNDEQVGTSKPLYWQRGALQKKVEVHSDSSQIMNNVTRINYGNPTSDHETSAIYIKAVNAIRNLKMKIIVNGKDTEFYPSEQAWIGREYGIDLVPNLNRIPLKPHYSSLVEYNIVLELKADDSINLLGNGTIPYIALDFNEITRKPIALEEDLPNELTGQQIVSKLENLTGDNRLGIEDLKNVETTISGDYIATKLQDDYGVALLKDGTGDKYLSDNGTYKTIIGGTGTEKVEFSKIFAVRANNKTGNVINAGTFVYLEAENDSTFNVVNITKAMGYKGELIGYTLEEVKDNDEGVFNLIASIKTNTKTLTEGESAYIGFTTGDLIDNTIAIGRRSDIAQPFGRCGAFGKSDTDGNTYAIYNASSIISDYFGKQGGTSATPTIAQVLAEGNIANGLSVTNLGAINGVVLTDAGDGSAFLSNNGTYKTIGGSGSVGTLSQVLAEGDDAQGENIENIGQISVKSTIGTHKWLLNTDDDGTFRVRNENNQVFFTASQDGKINQIPLTDSGDGTKLLADDGTYKVVNGSDPTLATKVQANTDELNRIKTDISDGSKPIFAFRDRGYPTESDLTKEDYKAYYIHITVMRTNASIQLPPNKAEDTLLYIENNDRSDYVILSAPNGETINSVSSFKCDSDTLNLFIKKGTNWVQAFGGIFPNSMDSLKTSVQSLLSTQLHTIDEIEAQLKSAGLFRDIQNYLQKYLRTDDQFDALATSLGFSKGFSVGYGFLDDQTVPNDKTWITAYISPNQEVLIPKTSGSKYVGIYMPVFFEPLVSEVKINNAVVETTTKEIVINELRFAVLVTNTPIDASQNIRLQIVFSDALANATKGITIDDGTTDKAGIKKVNIEGAYLSKVFDDSDEVTLICSTEFEQQGGVGGGRVNKVLIENPLNSYLDPSTKPGEPNRMILGIQHDYFELKKPPGYLAYLSENEEVIGRTIPGETGVRSGTIWFDDVVVGNDGFLEVDKPNKAIGIQDYTDDDPNVTGGIPTLITFRAVMKGQAPNDGFVELILKKTDEGTPTQDGSLLLNANGNPIGVTREYKAGQDLGKLEAMAIYMAKELTKFQCILKHSFVDDFVMLEDRTEGASGLCIQALGKEYATGDALLQFENDTMQNIEMSKHYNGEDIFNIAWALGYNRADVDINAGNGQTTVDGLHFYNNTNLKVGVANKTVHIHDNGIDMAYFSLGQIFSAEKTLMLRNKDLDVKVTLQDKRNAYRIYMVKWTGTPDAYTKKVIDHYNPDNGAIPETNWVLDGSVFISEDVVSGEHDFQGVLTVPSDANNFAVVIVPVVKQLPIDLYMKAFEIDVSEPFYGWILEAPELVGEKHLQFSEKHKELRCDVKGYQEVRYTLNNVPAGQPMPIGVLGKGLADIEIDHAINQVSGSQLPQFEGAIKFLKDGEATIETELYVHSEISHGTLATTKFWYSKVSTDGQTFTKIPLSEYDVDVRGQTKAINKMPKFKITVEAGDRIALFGTSDQVDGAYLDQKAGDPLPMLRTTIDFNEITQQTQDLLDRLIQLEKHADELLFVKDGKPVDNPEDYKLKVDVGTAQIEVSEDKQ